MKDENYGRIMFIPVILIVISLCIIGYNCTIKTGVISKAGISVRVSDQDTGYAYDAAADSENGGEDGETAADKSADSAADKKSEDTRVDLNNASEEEIDSLPGIGKKRAAAIVDARKSRNGFKSIEDLAAIKGIGNEIIDSMRDMVVISEYRGEPSDTDKKDDGSVKKININTASAEELQELEGVGATRAEKIIEKREELDGFRSAEDIMQVSGIGEESFERMKAQICVE